VHADMLFVPSPEAVAHQELIFQAWRCALGDARVIYCSGPITTGKRLIETIMADEGGQSRERVIAENSKALLNAAAELRANVGSIVIEPASLHVGGWSQDDYLHFWTELIERHAKEVRFLPDWAFSNGCAHEFERALIHNISTRTLDGSLITPAVGIAALREACAELKPLAIAAPTLEPLRASLTRVLARMEARV
jgi:hypothetical protein